MNSQYSQSQMTPITMSQYVSTICSDYILKLFILFIKESFQHGPGNRFMEMDLWKWIYGNRFMAF